MLEDGDNFIRYFDLYSCLQSCAAEHEVWEAQHYDPKIFKTDPGGIVYQRYI